METNALPEYRADDNPTGCCPRFDPKGWDAQELHFKDKLFLRATTRSENYVPVDMGPVFEDTFTAMFEAGAYDSKDIIVLSRDLSPSEAEHLFAVSKPVPGKDAVRLSGDYLTKVFEGPFEEAPEWDKQVRAAVDERNGDAGNVYYFYTTCPKCAETYGKNYVVAVAELAGPATPAH